MVAGPGASFDWAHLPGYLAAAACALIWSGYSLLSRRLGAAPTETVAVFCLATAALSLVAHLALETTAWPAGALGWLAMLALGLGPVGLAFYLWDIGCKRGDIQLLGTASYAAPLVSTLILIAAGFAEPTPTLLARRGADRRRGAAGGARREGQSISPASRIARPSAASATDPRLIASSRCSRAWISAGGRPARRMRRPWTMQ